MGATIYCFHAENEQATQMFAQKLAEKVEVGSVITLDGDLGAGKTRWTQSFAQAIGVQGIVNSPTFTLIKEYMGRLPLYHMDVYRLSEAEADELGLDEYLFGDGVTVIEWASKITNLLPSNLLKVNITYTGEASRLFALCPIGEPYKTWCENGVAEGWLQYDS